MSSRACYFYPAIGDEQFYSGCDNCEMAKKE